MVVARLHEKAFAVFAAVLRRRVGASSGLHTATTSFRAIAKWGKSAVHCGAVDGYELTLAISLGTKSTIHQCLHQKIRTWTDDIGVAGSGLIAYTLLAAMLRVRVAAFSSLNTAFTSFGAAAEFRPAAVHCDSTRWMDE